MFLKIQHYLRLDSPGSEFCQSRNCQGARIHGNYNRLETQVQKRMNYHNLLHDAAQKYHVEEDFLDREKITNNVHSGRNSQMNPTDSTDYHDMYQRKTRRYRD